MTEKLKKVLEFLVPIIVSVVTSFIVNCIIFLIRI